MSIQLKVLNQEKIFHTLRKNKNIDHSTTSNTLEVTIKYVGNQFYSRYDLYDEVNDITMPIYCSNASQLTFLEPYKGQKVTIDFTVVN